MLRSAYPLLFAIGAGAFFLASGAGIAFELVTERRLPPVKSEQGVVVSLEDQREVAVLQPRNPLAWSVLGDALRAAGEPAEATRAYERAVALPATPADVHASLAVLYYRQGRVELARRQARAAHAKGASVDPRLLRALGLGMAAER